MERADGTIYLKRTLSLVLNALTLDQSALGYVSRAIHQLHPDDTKTYISRDKTLVSSPRYNDSLSMRF